MKKILILGGTQFIGRNLVEKLLEENKYDLTLYNRQRTGLDLFPELRKIKGDREKREFGPLTDEHWDVVVDLSAYYPDSLSMLLKELKGKAGRYIFISTISVYDLRRENAGMLTEDMETMPCSMEERANTEMKTYGQRKAECERVILNEEKLDKIILRPSLVYGKYDHTDRFYYWMYRVRHCAKFILPDGGKMRMNLTNVNDLCSMILQAMEAPEHGFICNAATHEPLSLATMIGILGEQIGTRPELVNMPGEMLSENNIRTSMDIPLWFKIDLEVSLEKAIRALGMKFTPFRESVKELAAHFEKNKWHLPKAGMSLEKETALMGSSGKAN